MKTIPIKPGLISVMIALATMSSSRAVTFTMPYYDIEYGALAEGHNTDWVSFRGDPQDSWAPKNSVLSYTLTYRAHAGYVLTAMGGGAQISEWAGAGQGGWTDRIVISLNGTEYDTGYISNSNYGQNGQTSLWTSMRSIVPTTTAIFRVDYYMSTYGTGVVHADPFTSTVTAALGSPPSVPDVAATAAMLSAALAGIAALRRTSPLG